MPAKGTGVAAAGGEGTRAGARQLQEGRLKRQGAVKCGTSPRRGGRWGNCLALPRREGEGELVDGVRFKLNSGSAKVISLSRAPEFSPEK